MSTELVFSIKDNNTRIDILTIYGGYDIFAPINDNENILTHEQLNEWANDFKNKLKLTQKKMYFIERGNDDPDYLYEQWKDERDEANYCQAILNYIETLHQIIDNVKYNDNAELKVIYWWSY